MTQTAVVILNYNGRDYLRQFLPTLIQHTPKARLIVADNCSTDDSIEVLKGFEAVEVIQLPQNYGYAGGYNEALKQIQAEFYLLLNSDVEVTPNWLVPMEEFLNTNQEYSAVQPKILDFHRKEYFEYAGAAGGFLDSLAYPYCRGRLFDTLEKDEGQYDSPMEVSWCSGACFLVRSAIFRKLGGFDADFFAHMEEIDLCWRMRSNGHRLICLPNSTVYHVGGGTLNKAHWRKTYYNFRNGLSLLFKNLPVSYLIWVLPIRLALDLIAALKLWKTHSFDHFRAVIKGDWEALTKLGKSLNKRDKKTDPLLSWQPRTPLLIHYYLMGIKRFNQL